MLMDGPLFQRLLLQLEGDQSSSSKRSLEYVAVFLRVTQVPTARTADMSQSLWRHSTTTYGDLFDIPIYGL